MAEASAATTIHEHDGHNVYSSGGACLRHARPHHLCCPLYVVSSAVALPKRLHRLWVTGRLYTSRPSFVYSSGGACLRHAPASHRQGVRFSYTYFNNTLFC